MQNLTKEWKQLPVVILQQANFYNIFILCLWLRIIRRSDQGVKFINFSFTDIFLIPFHMAVASYCYYEKMRRMIGPAIVSYFLKYFCYFSAAQLDNIESEEEVFTKEFSYEESDSGDSDDEDIL